MVLWTELSLQLVWSELWRRRLVTGPRLSSHKNSRHNRSSSENSQPQLQALHAIVPSDFERLLPRQKPKHREVK